MKRLLLVLPLIALGAGACASVSASGKAKDSPALNVPPAPARIIEPAPEPMPEPVSELPAPPSATAAPPKPNRPRENARPPATDPKTEPKPVEPPPPEPAPVTPPAQPPAQLRTPQTADSDSAMKTVRTIIDRANAVLNGIDYRPLTDIRKKAYDDAKRFILQAEDALKQHNFVFAQAVATKAETLARELAGR